MNFKEYQKSALKMAFYPKIKEYPIGLFYAVIGLNGEAGEVAEEVKKSWRNNMEVTEERREKIKGELGDTLWYLAAVAQEVGLSLDDIAKQNVAKLTQRHAEDNIKHE